MSLKELSQTIKGSLLVHMGKGHRDCMKHQFTLAYLNGSLLGLPHHRLGGTALHFLRICKLFCCVGGLLSDACSQESYRNKSISKALPVQNTKQRCGLPSLCHSLLHRHQFCHPGALSLPPLWLFCKPTCFQVAEIRPAMQQYVSKTLSMTTQGPKPAASSESAREGPWGQPGMAKVGLRSLRLNVPNSGKGSWGSSEQMSPDASQ